MGYVVFVSGIEFDDEKVLKVKEWFIFIKLEEVRKFLGFVGYYRKFVRDFLKIV